MNPTTLFESWYQEVKAQATVSLPSACCLSSVGFDGYPNSRFVSLKEIVEEKFVITGPLNSRKGLELMRNPKTSLTFWWSDTEKQVRIQGDARPLPVSLAEKYFGERHKASQLISTVFKQGEEIESFDQLEKEFQLKQKEFEQIVLERPDDWSGFYIDPVRIEFMEFQHTRLHKRTLFQKKNGAWEKALIQP